MKVATAIPVCKQVSRSGYMKGKGKGANSNASNRGGSGRESLSQANAKLECWHLMLQKRVYSINNHSQLCKIQNSSQSSHIGTAYSVKQISLNQTATLEMSQDSTSFFSLQRERTWHKSHQQRLRPSSNIYLLSIYLTGDTEIGVRAAARLAEAPP